MENSHTQRVYFPALDGLRFLAFLLVFYNHLPHIKTIPITGVLREYGWVGVDLFLCLSAYLFTKLLFVEFQGRGEIHIPYFYLRRLLRIWPLYYFYFFLSLALLLPTEAVGPDMWRRAFGMVTFTDNIYAAIYGFNIFFSPHLWTISYEEQFYLVIPWFLQKMFALRRSQQIFILAFIFLVGSCIRAVFIVFHIHHPAIYVLPITHFEAILGGLAVGLDIFHGRFSRLWCWMTLAGGILLLSLLPLLAEVTFIGWQLMLVYPLVGGGMMLILLAVVKGEQTLFAKLLRWPVLTYLGKISYGLYVYQFIGVRNGYQLAAWVGITAKRLVVFPLSVFGFGLLTTISIAALSYQLLERPFLKLKHRFSLVYSRPV
ncbi:MAG: hypothetical protein Fur0043_20120 [Anaerolineales bacterium]